MSTIKRHMEEMDSLREQALEILIKVNCVERCDGHEEVCLEVSDDLEPAYKLANAMITWGDIELPEGKNRKWFTDLIDGVFADNRADECYSCARNMED